MYDPIVHVRNCYGEVRTETKGSSLEHGPSRDKRYPDVLTPSLQSHKEEGDFCFVI